MVGNAVPALLTEVLAREIACQLLGARPVAGACRLLPPLRGDAPPPESVASLPRKFRSLMGEHTEHPGEGRGNAAIRRVAGF